MGAFNTVTTMVLCPRCQNWTEVRVQFKYGSVRQHEYLVGDKIRWGGHQLGDMGRRLVVVDGVAENPCSRCGYDEEWGFYIFLWYDRIIGVVPSDGTWNFADAGTNYIVICE